MAKFFAIQLVAVALIACTLAQDISFSADSKPSKAKKPVGPSKGDIVVRAPSTFQNCLCQCSSYSWKDSRGYTRGNCRSSDNTGAKFCYISSAAASACRDVKYSTSRKDEYGNPLKYSYEACDTPPIHQCGNNQQHSGLFENVGSQNNYPNNNYPNNNYPSNNYPSNNYPSNNYPSNNYPSNYPNYRPGGRPGRRPSRRPVGIRTGVKDEDKKDKKKKVTSGSTSSDSSSSSGSITFGDA